jgi:hypothetical protein
LDADLTHQPPDTFVVHLLTQTQHQSGVHPWPPIPATRLGMNDFDLLHQLPTPQFGMAMLDGRAMSYGDVRRYDEAVASVEEAVALYRELAADNPIFSPDLSDALDMFRRMTRGF